MSYEMAHTCRDGVEVTVTFSMVGSYHKGACEYGRPLDPDSYPEVEIESILDSDGNDYEASDEDLDEIMDLSYEYAEECAEEAKGDAMISAWEDNNY